MDILINAVGVGVSTVLTVSLFLCFCACLGLVAILAAGRDDNDEQS